MKMNLRVAVGTLLAVGLFVGILPISSAMSVKVKLDRTGQERTHIKRGAEVGKRVRDLQKYNRNVSAALAQFEKNGKRNGNKPKHDESVSVIQDPAGGSAALNRAKTSAKPFRQVSFKPQDPDYSNYGVEMILIPTYSNNYEWQGTVILNGFDPFGDYLGQYVADVAMAVDSTETWDVFYESAYYDGQGYLLYGNPLFELGTPRDSQDPSVLQPVIYSARRLNARRAHVSAMTPQAGFGGPPGGIFSHPKVRWVMKCTAIGSAGMAARCGLAALFGGGPFIPCQGAGSAGVFTVCTLTAILT